ncbi:hypothetical protein [Companilactobacillus nodensis]|uniref:Uncharacterized protein n=1 Tax=Companilactobacillus nodensis DSM 19682 = JCM 14932 = NBRC 107160 TaxID=1423775 RepID=A0A0R1K6U4_9LACO|nr:hypothetical protein [Companilactobacillus nodensis]KRK79301.1 hypothetical protein FD03_GL001667 [Companilactobacillus nodensis DSM 19682 = JCM 14932 = NBRC 107160]
MGKIKLKNTKVQKSIQSSEFSKLKLNDILDSKEKRIAFNFSFLSDNDKYNLNNKKFGIQSQYLFRRIHEMSELSMVELIVGNKRQTLEVLKEIDLPSNAKLLQLVDHKEFGIKRANQSRSKYYIFRLCKNNNPYETRIIGRFIDPVFYIMYLDFEHKLYAPRR